MQFRGVQQIVQNEWCSLDTNLISVNPSLTFILFPDHTKALGDKETC
jgi:hypothetical protein